MKQKSLASFFSASGAKKPPAPAKASLGPIAKDLQKARTITDVDQNTEIKAGVSQNKKRNLTASAHHQNRANKCAILKKQPKG